MVSHDASQIEQEGNRGKKGHNAKVENRREGKRRML